MYVYRKPSSQSPWSQAGIPFDESLLDRRIFQEQQNAESVKRSTQTGRIPSGGRIVNWAIIEVDEDIEPSNTMTDDEMRQQNIVASS